MSALVAMVLAVSPPMEALRTELVFTPWSLNGVPLIHDAARFDHAGPVAQMSSEAFLERVGAC